MKIYCTMTIFMVQVFFSALFAQVTTPNGTQVDCKIHSEGDIALFEAQASQWLSARGWTDSVTRIGSATLRYNCHAYAWYKSEGGRNNYWVNAFLNSEYDVFNPYSHYSTPPAPNNINKYWNDWSYVEVETEQEATKIWFGSCWEWTGYEWSNKCDHSAIRLSSGLYQSKWGAWPLYRHPADKCPYNITNRRYFKKGVYISGPQTVMNEATYSIANLPDGITVQWSASNENLELISGQGTDTATFRSKYFVASTINATITTCDSFTIRYNVSTDFDLDEVYIDGPDFVCDNTATFTVRNLPQPSTVSFDHGPFMADSVYTVFISSYSDSPGVAKVLAEANCLGKKLRWSIFSVLTNRGSIMWKTP